MKLDWVKTRDSFTHWVYLEFCFSGTSRLMGSFFFISFPNTEEKLKIKLIKINRDCLSLWTLLKSLCGLQGKNKSRPGSLVNLQTSLSQHSRIWTFISFFFYILLSIISFWKKILPYFLSNLNDLLNKKQQNIYI